MRYRVFAAVALSALALAPAARAACCYFAAKDKDINQPGQKAFITWEPVEKIETFTVQPKFEGNALDFGMVIPTPSEPKLAEMPRDFFKDLAIYTILMPLPKPMFPMVVALAGRAMKDGGRENEHTKVPSDKGVTVLAQGVVGSLDYKVIVAEKADGLYDWLKENSYAYSGDTSTLDFYVKKKWFFTVMKIDPKQMKKAADGSYVGEVTPTRFTFESERCIYPLKITQISVKDTTDALIYIQAKEQMDLPGELSFMHSYRCMYLTYCLGCGAGPTEQKELQVRNEWMQKKKAQDARFDTTKLEWARKLGDAEIAVLEDPLKNYAQMGNMLPDGSSVISRDEFLKEYREDFDKQYKDVPNRDEIWKSEIKELDQEHPDGKGVIVKNEKVTGYYAQKYMWYPNREAPDEDVKGLTRLKGHLQKGKWLTKIRKHIRKDEMSDDLVFSAVPQGQEQDYTRIMPTSPP